MPIWKTATSYSDIWLNGWTKWKDRFWVAPAPLVGWQFQHLLACLQNTGSIEVSSFRETTQKRQGGLLTNVHFKDPDKMAPSLVQPLSIDLEGSLTRKHQYHVSILAEWQKTCKQVNVGGSCKTSGSFAETGYDRINEAKAFRCGAHTSHIMDPKTEKGFFKFIPQLFRSVLPNARLL